MLIRRKIVQTNPEPTVENNVTIVKPRRPTGLLAGLGVATLLAVGAVMYLSWYLPGTGSGYVDSAAVVTPVESRPERFSKPAPKPNTIIVNPPPVIQTPPPVVNTQPPVINVPPPVVVTPPSRTVIVPGSSSEPPADNTGSGSSSSNGTGTSDNGSTGDVDGTIRGSGE